MKCQADAVETWNGKYRCVSCAKTFDTEKHFHQHRDKMEKVVVTNDKQYALMRCLGCDSARLATLG